MKTLITLTTTFIILSTTSLLAKNNTPKYWKCLNRISGNWDFGEAPQACSVDSFLSSRFVNDNFSPYIFDLNKNRSREKERYMIELNHFITSTADYYLKKRKPTASKAERTQWKKSLLAVAHQESFWSHYRIPNDKKIRLMRGDFGHGHGMMQIDDRWHFANVKSGKAANLMSNLIYALDEYYASWSRATQTSCVKNKKDYYTISRAAYSAYNGGKGAICRFTNPRHRWARNDKNFKQKLDKKSWNRYLSSNTKPSPLNIECLISQKPNCDSVPPAPPTAKKKVLSYKNYLCSLEEKTYECISQPQYRFCLVDRFNLINEVITTDIERPVNLLSKDDVCNSSTDQNSIYPVSSKITTNTTINLRETPGGKLIGSINPEFSYQVLDVHVSTNQSQSRYYLIKDKDLLGYIYAGNRKTQSNWIRLGGNPKLLLPVQDGLISVKAPSGINLRATPGGKRLLTIPTNTELQVLENLIKDNSRIIYVKVSYRGVTGYIYTGQVIPKYTVSDWIRILE